MNTEFDSLEAELRALRPRDPSPELARRIANELAASPPAPRRLWPRHYLAVAATLAASLLVAAFVRRPETRQIMSNPPPLAASPASAPFDAALPSVWQFHQAIKGSSVTLDALLDQHTARAPAPAVSLVQIRGLGRSDTQLNTLFGEF